MSNKLKVLITGATGLIGNQICLALLEKGHDLVILGRRSEDDFKKDFTLPCKYYRWKDPTTSQPPSESLDVDAVIHLMGESIAEHRWTESHKKELRDSRILSTQLLVSALQQFNPKLRTFISTSAIGYYGDAGDQTLNEDSPSSQDFLGKLCSEWELESKKAPGRCVQIRIGIVLSNAGGALGKMVPLFEKGLGGKLGNGKQWMSWIHILDLVNIFVEALENPTMKGPYNAASPEAVNNLEFTQTLAKQLKVSALVPTPRIALQLALGEMAQIVLASQKVQPKALLTHGFTFGYTRLADALKDLYGWKESQHDRIFQAFQWVPRSRDSVFPFFSSVKNLEILTPEFLNFQVLKQTTEQVHAGTEIDYQLTIHGVPVKWKTRITDWNPNHQFKDLQLKGPYNKWDHTHTFKDLADGTLLSDQVIYRLPLASWGGNLASPFIKADIKKIFSFRKAKIHELFG